MPILNNHWDNVTDAGNGSRRNRRRRRRSNSSCRTATTTYIDTRSPVDIGKCFSVAEHGPTSTYSSDLLDLFCGASSKCSGNYLAPRDLMLPDFHLIVEKRFLSLPSDLRMQYDRLECRSFLGIFPDIHRAWISVDNKLFFWDYELNEYELILSTEHVITNVALVPPPVGVFLEDISHLLVLATAGSVHLFCLKASTPTVNGGFGNYYDSTNSSGAIHLAVINPNISVPADGASFRCIVGTKDGRILLGGEDGHIHELCYQALDFLSSRRKIQKVIHTKSIFEMFAPNFIVSLATLFSRSFADDPVLSMALSDDERPWLYALHASDAIRVVLLTSSAGDKNGFKMGPHFADVGQKINAACKESLLFECPSSIHVISLHPIHMAESRYICLLAITNTNCRAYFSMNFNHESLLPVELVLEFVRLPPYCEISHSICARTRPSTTLSSLNQIDIRTPLTKFVSNAHSAYYSDGLMLTSNAVSEDLCMLLCTSNEASALPAESRKIHLQQKQNSSLTKNQSTQLLQQQHRHHPSERAHVSHLDSNVWEICEVDSETGFIRRHLDKNYNLIEDDNPRHFLLLSGEGLRIFGKNRPLDELLYLLRQEVRDIKYFVESFGRDQTCCWLLAICCLNTGRVRSPLIPTRDAVNINLAKRHFFHYGGTPAQVPTTLQQSDRATVVSPSTLQHSGSYKGLELYMRRLIQPFWSKTILKQNQSGLYCAGVNEETLERAHTEFEKLVTFVRDWHPPQNDPTIPLFSKFENPKINNTLDSQNKCSYSETVLGRKDYSEDLHQHPSIGADGAYSWHQERTALHQRFLEINLIFESVKFAQILFRMRLPDIANDFMSGGVIKRNHFDASDITCNNNDTYAFNEKTGSDNSVLNSQSFSDAKYQEHYNHYQKQSLTELMEALGKRPFEFLITEAGRKFCGQLATTLVVQSACAAAHSGAETLSPQLREHCATLIHINDILTAMVLERLDARNMPNIAAIHEEALEIAQSVAGKLTVAQFESICAKFVQLDCTRAVLELSLLRAAEIDPSDDALRYLRDGQVDDDNRIRLLVLRGACYGAALDAMRELDARIAARKANDAPFEHLERYRVLTRNRALEFNDKIWHFAFYEFLAQQDDRSALLDIATASENLVSSGGCSTKDTMNSLEEWLLMPNNVATTMATALPHRKPLPVYERQLLLAQNYVLGRRFEKAAAAYYELATAESEDLSLVERIELLQRAQQSSKAASESSEQARVIRDTLDVATMQVRLLAQLHALPKSSNTQDWRQRMSENQLADLQTLYEIASANQMSDYVMQIIALSQDDETPVDRKKMDARI